MIPCQQVFRGWMGRRGWRISRGRKYYFLWSVKVGMDVEWKADLVAALCSLGACMWCVSMMPGGVRLGMVSGHWQSLPTCLPLELESLSGSQRAISYPSGQFKKKCLQVKVLEMTWKKMCCLQLSLEEQRPDGKKCRKRNQPWWAQLSQDDQLPCATATARFHLIYCNSG